MTSIPESRLDYLTAATTALYRCLSPDEQLRFQEEKLRALFQIMCPQFANQDHLSTERHCRLEQDVP